MIPIPALATLICLLTLSSAQAAENTLPAASSISPLANAWSAGKARQDKIEEIARNNPLATEEGNQIWHALFKAAARGIMMRHAKKAGLGNEWTPAHPKWPEIEQRMLGYLTGLIAELLPQTEVQLRKELQSFSDTELDEVLRAIHSPWNRRVEQAMLEALNLATDILTADHNDAATYARLQVAGEQQQQTLKSLMADPEINAYLNSPSGKKMTATSMNLFQSQVPKVTARAEIAEADMALQIAQLLNRPADTLLPLRNALMMAAAAGGDGGLMQQQITAGADPRARDERLKRNKESLLHHACSQADVALLDQVLSLTGRDLIDVTDASGRTPMQIAAQQGRLAHISRLIDQGADINKGNAGGTPLIAATLAGHRAVIELLLAGGANPNATDKFGNAALSLSLYWRQPKPPSPADQESIIALLLKHGANPLQRDKNGRSLLDQAAGMYAPSFAEQADRLIALGLRVDAAGPDGKTPLHHAVSAPVVTKLLALGAPINAADAQGNTPLHSAVHRSNEAVTKALVAAGADITLRNQAGETPTDLATLKKAPAVRESLLKFLGTSAH